MTQLYCVLRELAYSVACFIVCAAFVGCKSDERSPAALNPCNYYNSRYAFAIVDCVWRELPPRMLARFSPAFKRLVKLDDDGVFELLCRSINQRGDILLEAFANDYPTDEERHQFFSAVNTCHLEAVGNRDKQVNEQSDSAMLSESSIEAISSMSAETMRPTKKNLVSHRGARRHYFDNTDRNLRREAPAGANMAVHEFNTYQWPRDRRDSWFDFNLLR